MVCPSWPCTQLHDIWRTLDRDTPLPFALEKQVGSLCHVRDTRSSDFGPRPVLVQAHELAQHVTFDKCMAFHASALRYEDGALRDFGVVGFANDVLGIYGAVPI